MKFCPECGDVRIDNKCKCGFDFLKYESKGQEDISNHLFSEPGMREINQNNNYNEIINDFEKTKMTMYEKAKMMGVDNNLSSDEFEKLMKDKHFTA